MTRYIFCGLMVFVSAMARCSPENTTANPVASSNRAVDPGPKRAVPGELTQDRVRAVLKRCETAARNGNVDAYKACLSKQSIATTEALFAKTRATLKLAIDNAEDLIQRVRQSAYEETLSLVTVLKQRHIAANARMIEANWRTWLKRSAQDPPIEVTNVRQDQQHATFDQKRGTEVHRHALVWEADAWRFDLVADAAYLHWLREMDERATEALRALTSATQSLSYVLAKLPRATP